MDARFDALAELVEHLGAEVERLRAQVSELQRSSRAGTRPLLDVAVRSERTAAPAAREAGTEDTAMPRRRLMRLFGSTAAVGAAAVGATMVSATPAAAATGDPLIIGTTNDGGKTATSLAAVTTATATRLDPATLTLTATKTQGDNTYPVGVLGVSGDRVSTPYPYVAAGVIGESEDGVGVVARGHNGSALTAQSDHGIAVDALSSSGSSAVRAIAQLGIGIYAQSDRAKAIYATSSLNCGVYALSGAQTSSDGIAAVFCVAGANPGVVARSTTSHGVVGLAEKAPRTAFPPSGVLGQAVTGRGVTGMATTGTGVFGQAGPGVGVLGTAVATGIAGQFSGGRAQLYLVPSATTGAPTAGDHKVGELFMDQTGALYVCKTAGTPGTWKLLG